MTKRNLVVGERVSVVDARGRPDGHGFVHSLDKGGVYVRHTEAARTDADVAKEWRDAKTTADCARALQESLEVELRARGYTRVGNAWTRTKTETVKI